MAGVDGHATLRYMTQPTHFQVIPDFNGQSRNGAKCSITNLPKIPKQTPQQQPHEIDEFILRGPEIEFEGYFDIRPAVIIDTAREVFDMVTAEEYESVVAELAMTADSLTVAQDRIEELEGRLEAFLLTREELMPNEDIAALVDGGAW